MTYDYRLQATFAELRAIRFALKHLEGCEKFDHIDEDSLIRRIDKEMDR